jgi:DNA helicase-2/ATP-dependent DNA helicase PcrA
LSTVHRVKGREWPRVILLGADEGLLPHRLAGSVEEERRVFHVAVTRGVEQVVVLADAASPSRFVAETLCQRTAGDGPESPPGLRGDRRGRPATAAPRAARAAGAGDRLQPASDRRSGRVRPAREVAEDDRPLYAALSAWRREVARRAGVPAFVVFSDLALSGIATARPRDLAALSRCWGVGPQKLDLYGDELLALVVDESDRAGPKDGGA